LVSFRSSCTTCALKAGVYVFFILVVYPIWRDRVCSSWALPHLDIGGESNLSV